MKIVLEITPISFGFDVDVQPDDQVSKLSPEDQATLANDIEHAMEQYLLWSIDPQKDA